MFSLILALEKNILKFGCFHCHTYKQLISCNFIKNLLFPNREGSNLWSDKPDATICSLLYGSNRKAKQKAAFMVTLIVIKLYANPLKFRGFNVPLTKRWNLRTSFWQLWCYFLKCPWHSTLYISREILILINCWLAYSVSMKTARRLAQCYLIRLLR